GFSVRAVGDGYLAIPVAQGFRVLRILQRLQANEMTIPFKDVVVSETFLDEGLTLAIRHDVELLFIYVGQTKKLHNLSLAAFTYRYSVVVQPPRNRHLKLKIFD